AAGEGFCGGAHDLRRCCSALAGGRNRRRRGGGRPREPVRRARRGLARGQEWEDRVPRNRGPRPMNERPTPRTILLTAAQATVRWLAAQRVVVDGMEVPFFAGAWAIFGHGNVAGLGEALHAAGDVLPTWRAHNEQAMAHAAIAYAKQMRRRRAMVCTSSIGPGATNMV